jgi:hypothetical protein
MRTLDEVDWEALRADFDPADIDFRIQSTFERSGGTQATVIAYVDARAIQDRLDRVVGPANWAFDWIPMLQTASAITAAKGTLTICGLAKSDVGDAGTTEPTKASVSDALKRAAVMWGIGRSLYALPVMFVTPEKRGNSWIIPDGELKKLRAQLGGPKRQTERQQQQYETKQGDQASAPASGKANPADVFPAPQGGAQPEQRQDVDPEPAAAATDAPDIPMPAMGSKAYWQAVASEEQQKQVVELLRRKNYNTRGDVAEYFSQLAKTRTFTADDVAALVDGRAKWMNRALHKLAIDDLNRREDHKKGA